MINEKANLANKAKIIWNLNSDWTRHKIDQKYIQHTFYYLKMEIYDPPYINNKRVKTNAHSLETSSPRSHIGSLQLLLNLYLIRKLKL